MSTYPDVPRTYPTGRVTTHPTHPIGGGGGDWTLDPKTGAGWVRRAVVGNAPAPRLLAALAAGLLLAGCGSTAADTTPTPTPTHSYELTIVNDTSYELLLRLGPKDSVDSLIKTVCASTDPPQYLIDTVLASEPDAKLYVRLAVMAGCPERKDWS